MRPVHRLAYLKRAGVAALAIVLGVRILELFRTDPHARLWDFNAYYYAALAWQRGLDPYAPSNVRMVAHGANVFDYKYPPLLLPCFGALTRLEHPTALLVYRCLLVAALVAFVVVVSRGLLRRLLDPFVLVAVLGLWSYSVSATMLSGNAELFTILATWAGIAWLCAGSDVGFGVSTTVAALPKLDPASFALVALAVHGTRGRRAFGLALSGVLGWLAANTLFNIRLTIEWLGVALHTAHKQPPSSWVEPSLAGLLATFPGSSTVVVRLLCIAVATGAALVLWRARGAPPVGKACLAVVTIALLWPRFMDYSFLTFVPAIAWLGRDLYDQRGRARVLGVLAGAVVLGFSLLRKPTDPSASAWLANAPSAFALCLWAALLVRVWLHPAARSSPVPANGSA